MTKSNQSNNRNAKIESNTEHSSEHTTDSINPIAADHQQVSVKAWSQKLLVVVLCMASFYGGWKSYESNTVNDCTANGGQIVEGKKTLLCQLS